MMSNELKPCPLCGGPGVDQLDGTVMCWDEAESCEWDSAKVPRAAWQALPRPDSTAQDYETPGGSESGWR
jgi:hypothetical protein